MLPSQFKHEYMAEDDSELVLTSSQEELLIDENRSVLDFADINNIMNLPFSGPYPSLYEPTRPTFAPPTGALPVLDDWAGMYNFQLNLSSTFGRSIVYSEKLGKLFANINTNIPVEFKIAEFACEELMVRALPVFTATQDCQLPVKRCISHSTLEGESNQGAHVNHVIRCDHLSSQYHCDDQSGRLSVVVTMEAPQAGVDKIKLMYEFVCKNSCPGGMNRRPIAIVFTLERHSGEVVGRRHLKVRICSCPKRDMKKEEIHSEFSDEPPGKKKHLLPKPQAAASKRLKKEEEIYHVPVTGFKRMVMVAMTLHGHQLTEAQLENRALTPCELALQKKYYNIMMTDQCAPHANSSPPTPQD